MRHLHFILILALAAFNCGAQTSRRVPVVVDYSGEDAVGAALAFQIREGIRGSQGMRLAIDSDANPRIVVHLASLDGGNKSNPGVSTTMTVVIAYDSNELPHSGYLVAVRLQACGTQRTHECSSEILAKIDSAIEGIRKEYPQSYQKLR